MNLKAKIPCGLGHKQHKKYALHYSLVLQSPWAMSSLNVILLCCTQLKKHNPECMHVWL